MRKPMKLVDPTACSVREVIADTNDWNELRSLIGCSLIEPVKLRAPEKKLVTVFCDESARCYNQPPPRFLLPDFRSAGGEPFVIYGKALLAGEAEVVFPTERRVTPLDCDPRTLGLFVKQRAAEASNESLNFQAILSDERYVAASRVVLATFENDIIAAAFSVDLCPVLELEISTAKRDAAFQLFDEVLDELGAPKGWGDDEEEDGDGSENGWAILAQPHKKHVLPTGAGKSGFRACTGEPT